MLETTIAGSLPKPSWLAEPNMLWAPWRLDGEARVSSQLQGIRIEVDLTFTKVGSKLTIKAP